MIFGDIVIVQLVTVGVGTFVVGGKVHKNIRILPLAHGNGPSSHLAIALSALSLLTDISDQ